MLEYYMYVIIAYIITLSVIIRGSLEATKDTLH